MNFFAGQQWREFEWFGRGTDVDGQGRVSRAAKRQGVIRAAAAEIGPRDRELARQYGHPVTHRLIVRGRAFVKEGDLLIHGGERFYVRALRDAGMLGLYTVMICEKRRV